jgi:hypothetical protein
MQSYNTHMNVTGASKQDGLRVAGVSHGHWQCSQYPNKQKRSTFTYITQVTERCSTLD